MGRLIDADAITESKELAKKIKLFDFEPYIKTEDLIEFIDKLPTAYDISKVVAELKKNKVSNVDLYDENNESWNDDIVSFDTTINIVRKGGVE